MFEPEKVLKGLPLNDMTPAQLIAEIQRIAAGAHRRAHFDYYAQQLGAIKILADLAAERLQAAGDG